MGVAQPAAGVQTLGQEIIERAKPPGSMRAKERAKAEVSTDVIAPGRYGVPRSNSKSFAQRLGDAAPPERESFGPSDVVYISVPGRSRENQNEIADATIAAAQRALDAGATVITDTKANAYRPHNRPGEGKLYRTLEANGYIPTEHDEFTSWTKGAQARLRGDQFVLGSQAKQRFTKLDEDAIRRIVRRMAYGEELKPEELIGFIRNVDRFSAKIPQEAEGVIRSLRKSLRDVTWKIRKGIESAQAVSSANAELSGETRKEIVAYAREELDKWRDSVMEKYGDFLKSLAKTRDFIPVGRSAREHVVVSAEEAGEELGPREQMAFYKEPGEQAPLRTYPEQLRDKAEDLKDGPYKDFILERADYIESKPSKTWDTYEKSDKRYGLQRLYWKYRKIGRPRAEALAKRDMRQQWRQMQGKTAKDLITKYAGDLTEEQIKESTQLAATRSAESQFPTPPSTFGQIDTHLISALQAYEETFGEEYPDEIDPDVGIEFAGKRDKAQGVPFSREVADQYKRLFKAGTKYQMKPEEAGFIIDRLYDRWARLYEQKQYEGIEEIVPMEGVEERIQAEIDKTEGDIESGYVPEEIGQRRIDELKERLKKAKRLKKVDTGVSPKDAAGVHPKVKRIRDTILKEHEPDYFIGTKRGINSEILETDRYFEPDPEVEENAPVYEKPDREWDDTAFEEDEVYAAEQAALGMLRDELFETSIDRLMSRSSEDIKFDRLISILERSRGNVAARDRAFSLLGRLYDSEEIKQSQSREDSVLARQFPAPPRKYQKTDVVYASARGLPDVVELNRAMQAGATIVTALASGKSFLFGERALARFLYENGYKPTGKKTKYSVEWKPTKKVEPIVPKKAAEIPAVKGIKPSSKKLQPPQRILLPDVKSDGTRIPEGKWHAAQKRSNTATQVIGSVKAGTEYHAYMNEWATRSATRGDTPGPLNDGVVRVNSTIFSKDDVVWALYDQNPNYEMIQTAIDAGADILLPPPQYQTKVEKEIAKYLEARGLTDNNTGLYRRRVETMPADAQVLRIIATQEGAEREGTYKRFIEDEKKRYKAVEKKSKLDKSYVRSLGKEAYITEGVEAVAVDPADGEVKDPGADKIGMYRLRNEDGVFTGWFLSPGKVLFQGSMSVVRSLPIIKDVDFEKLTHKFVDKVIDEFASLNDLVGNEDVADSVRAWLAAREMAGLNERIWNRVRRDHIVPLASMIEHSGIDKQTVNEFFIALHAAERNLVMWDKANPPRVKAHENLAKKMHGIGLSEISDDMIDEEWEQLKKIAPPLRGGSGRTDAWAATRLMELVDQGHLKLDLDKWARSYGYDSIKDMASGTWERQMKAHETMAKTLRDSHGNMKRPKTGLRPGGKLGEIRAKYDEILVSMTDHLYAAELFDIDRKQRVDNGYEFYSAIHLSDEREDAWIDNIEQVRHGIFDLRGQDVRYVGGFELGSEFNDIVSQTAAVYMRHIVRSNRNRVGQALYGYAMTHENELIEVLNETPTGQVVSWDGIKYEGLDDFTLSKNDIFAVAVKGKKKWIRIKDQRLATAIKSLDRRQAGAFLRGMQTATKALSMLATTLNPEFVFESNPMRDTLWAAAIGAGDRDVPGGMSALVNPLNIVRSAKGLWHVFSHGGFVDDVTSEDVRLAQQYLDDGAKMGHMGDPSVPTLRTDIDKEVTYNDKYVDEFGKKIYHTSFRGIYEWMEDASSVLENMYRLNAYRAALDAGKTRRQAAQIARDLTIDFNKSGSQQLMSAAYMFFNASVQGTVRIARTLSESPQMRKVMTGIVAAGMANAMANRLALGKDDDGQWLWDKRKKYETNTNIMVYFPGSDVGAKWAMPLGFNVPFVIGHELEQMIWAAAEGRPANVGSAAVNIVGAVFDVTNPIFGASDDIYTIIGNLLPSVARPIYSVVSNRTWYGGKIHTAHPDPSVARAWQGTEGSDAMKSRAWVVARAFSSWSRGHINFMDYMSRYKPGIIDFYPEDYQYIIEQYLGGLGKLILSGLNVAGKALEGEDVAVREIPFAKRVVTEFDPSIETRIEFSDIYNRTIAIHSDIKKAEEAGQYGTANMIRETFPVESQETFYEQVKMYNRNRLKFDDVEDQAKAILPALRMYHNLMNQKK